MKYNITDKSLIAFIDNELNTEPPKHYTDDGNSDRAILTRRRDSYFKSLKWCAKDSMSDYVRAIKSLNFDTSVGEIIHLVIATIIFPVVPFLREYFSVKQAVKTYKRGKV